MDIDTNYGRRLGDDNDDNDSQCQTDPESVWVYERRDICAVEHERLPGAAETA